VHRLQHWKRQAVAASLKKKQGQDAGIDPNYIGFSISCVKTMCWWSGSSTGFLVR
jgi:hypothetical protein